MYIRTKKVSRTKNTVVQLVASYRENGKTKQRVVRHIGTAGSPEKLEQLKQLAESIKLEQDGGVLAEEHVTVNPIFARGFGTAKPITKSTKIDLMQTQAQAHMILGIHDAYGFVYDSVGFANIFSRPKQREKAAALLREIVLARIANPLSKRASVDMLNKYFGVQINLDHVYQMMDKIDDGFCGRIQEKALKSALQLTGDKIKVLFYDATTLYFESFQEDGLKKNGYSKDMKFNQPQVLLALFVTEKGLPIGYEVFPGNTYEGHTLKPVLEKLKSRYGVGDIIFVADRGMLSRDNIAYLDNNKLHYIVGSRLKSLGKKQQQMIINWIESLEKSKVEKEVTHRIDLGGKQYLILSYKPSRAKKDKAERDSAIQKLQARLSRSKNPKQLISNYGFQKFISVSGDATLQIDEQKMEGAAIWDGVVGTMTNHSELTDQQVLEQYRGLWQVEESFRITKHDLRIRPIYHWTPKRVRAHIAISFMAFTCVRYLEYRLGVQYQKTSPEQIRKSLMGVQASILLDTKEQKEYLLPLPLDPTARQIYRALGIKVPQGVQKIAA